MIPSHIIDYLRQNNVPFRRLPHRHAVSAQELAASLHVTGHRVAKAVLVEADGQKYIAVLPAAENVDLARLTAVLGAGKSRFLSEDEFASIFQDCEVGAEPPFGRLYGLPVIVDSSLGSNEKIVFRAGSHGEALEINYSDFLALERPRIASFRMGPLFEELEAHPQEQM